MAGPTVTLTFAGDSDKLTRAMDDVGKSAEKMSSSVGRSSDKMRESGRSLEDLRESAGDTEQRFIGFRDSITGTGDILQGFRDGDLITTATGFADLAGGMEQFVLPALGRLWTAITASTVATTALTVAQGAWAAITNVVTIATEALNTVIKANPILFFVGLITVLVTAFLALWTHSEGFRNFFIGMWNDIKGVVQAVVNFIVNLWNGIPGFFATLPQRIGDALGALGGIIGNVFKGAINVLIDALNWGIDRINDLIYGINLINPFNDIPSIKHIPRLHQGGVVGGAPGTEQLAILRAGERVLTPEQQSGGANGAWIVHVDSSGAGALGEIISYLFRTNVIQLQTATGVAVRVV